MAHALLKWHTASRQRTALLVGATTLPLLLGCFIGRDLGRTDANVTASPEREEVVLRGRLRDESGGPVAGATLRYVPDALTQVAMGMEPPREERLSFAMDFGSLALDDLPLVKTGPGGDFEIKTWRFRSTPEDWSSWHHWTGSGLLVTSDGHASRMLSHSFFHPPSYDFGPITLSPEVRVRGIVINRAGEPIEGVVARLEVYTRWYPERRRFDAGHIYRLGDLDRAKTDRQGRFELAGLDTGGLFLSFSLDGHARRTLIAGAASGENVDLGRIVLPATGEIAGAVVDAQGKPVAGADVWLADANFDRRRTPGIRRGPRYKKDEDWTRDQIRALADENAPQTRTDDSGRFAVRGRGSPTYDLYVDVIGYEVMRIEDVEVGRTDLRVPLGSDPGLGGFPERTLTVVLVDEATGEELSDGSLTAYRVVDPKSARNMREIHSWPGLATELPVTESPEGFVVQGTGPVGTHLQVEVPGYVKAFTTVLGAAESSLRLALKRGSSVLGVVLDSTGKPVSGAKVYVVPVESPYRPVRGEAAGISDVDGAFTLRGLGGSEVVLHAIGAGVGASDRVRVAFRTNGGEHIQDLTLLPFGRVRGKVFAQDGSPESHEWVDLESIGEGQSWERRPSLDARADDEGRYEFSEVPPGRYRVNVGDMHHGRAGEEVRVGAGEESAVNVQLQDYTRIAGRVVSGGKGVPLADVSGTKEDEPFGYFAAWTHEDGRFDSWVEQPGTYALTVETPQGGRQGPKTITVADREIAEINFTLPTGAIKGRVLTKGRSGPLSGANVVLAGKGGMALAEDFTRTQGEFSFGHLPDGDFVLRVMPRLLDMENQGTHYSGGEWSLAVSGGRTTILDVEVPTGLTIGGEVRRPSGIPARDGTRVNLVRIDTENPFDLLYDGYSATTYTWNGRYRVSGVKPGTYRLLAEARSPEEVREKGVSVELRNADLHNVDLRLLSSGPRPVFGS